MGVIEGGVCDCAPISVNCVVNVGLIEEWALSGDMLWSAKASATGACECFGWVCGSEPLGVGACECVVDHKLESGGCGATGVEGVFCFLALLVFLHVDCSCPDRVVMGGRGF
jgi:hypothetical protein